MTGVTNVRRHLKAFTWGLTVCRLLTLTRVKDVSQQAIINTWPKVSNLKILSACVRLDNSICSNQQLTLSEESGRIRKQ